ncbi:hypothetical protein STEG23_007843 [Scotinomys teguina]
MKTQPTGIQDTCLFLHLFQVFMRKGTFMGPSHREGNEALSNRKRDQEEVTGGRWEDRSPFFSIDDDEQTRESATSQVVAGVFDVCYQIPAGRLASILSSGKGNCGDE